ATPANLAMPRGVMVGSKLGPALFHTSIVLRTRLRETPRAPTARLISSLGQQPRNEIVVTSSGLKARFIFRAFSPRHFSRDFSWAAGPGSQLAGPSALI